MKFPEARLQELEELGELQFTLTECALILQVDLEEFEKVCQQDTRVINAYERGRLKASAAVRKAILQQAKQGSTPAQKQMMELIEQVNKQPKPTKLIQGKLRSPDLKF